MSDDPKQEGFLTIDEFAQACQRIQIGLDEKVKKLRKKTHRFLRSAKIAREYIQAVNEMYSFQYLLNLGSSLALQNRQLRQLNEMLNSEHEKQQEEQSNIEYAQDTLIGVLSDPTKKPN